MENKIREPFDPNKKNYKTISEIEKIMEESNIKLSEEKIQKVIQHFQEKADFLDYPNIDDFVEQEEKVRHK